jgi:2-polyprenyl-3-methyl-5-hydroxy-6-metoxy-1,4-benzoquinol methylase
VPETTGLRGGEYALRGDYHRKPADDWDYWPTYVAKMRWVHQQLDRLPPSARVLDVGCGEGVLVEEYAGRLAIEGIDLNYATDRIRQGSVLDLPFGDSTFDRVLCLDVLEHVTHEEQPRALAEVRRVLKPGGEALLSLPNLAHLQSRLHFLLRGRLMRTANERKHPGDRPVGEYLAMLRAARFAVVEQRGVFPTVPVLTHIIRRHPVRLVWLHAGLTRLLPVPGWCFLNLVRAVAQAGTGGTTGARLPDPRSPIATGSESADSRG